MLKKWLSVKWWLSQLNWLVSLFWAKEVGYLIGLMLILLFVGVMDAAGWSLQLFSSETGLREIWGNLKPHLIAAFVHLFSPEKAAEKWQTMVLFFVSWLIGGGVLVSVMVGQYYKNTAGGFRRWRFLVGKHIVVLGWDNGLLAELAREVAARKRECYIVTNQNIGELGKLLAGAGVKGCYIYKGDYDNPTEWRENLRIHKAERVFIAGEKDEAAHDARVQILFEKVKKVCLLEKIKVNIHDFGLAQKLIAHDADGIYENFHLRWAKTALQGALRAIQGNTYSLFVVGFGAMGKAVVLEATLLEGKKAEQIVATDDDPEKFGDEKARFLAQFPHMENIVTFKGNWTEGLEKIVESNGRDAVIVVAKKRSEKGILCMMEIVSKLGDSVPSKTQLLLNQEVDGYVTGNDKEAGDIMQIGSIPIHLFGMKKGC